MKTRHSLPFPLLFTYVIILWIVPATGYSQETGSCAEKLKNAQALFDKGQVEQVSSMLSECMKSGFNREESLSAYKLLIQSLLFEEKLAKADSTMLAFLRLNPEYQISPTDHSSFVHLYNTFNVKPVVQIAGHFGPNLPFITFIGNGNNDGVSGFREKSTYSTKALSLFGSLEAKFELSKKIELNFEAGYSQLSFTNIREFTGIGSADNPETRSVIGITTYTEKQSRIEFPVTVTYNFKSYGKFTPYARLGFGTSLSMGAMAQKPIFIETAKNNSHIYSGPDIDRKDSRIFMDLFAQAGGGIKLKTRGGYVSAELRSNFGLHNQVIRGGNMANEVELKGFYKYKDDDFRTNTLNFSIGYTLIFYKPSKRKE